MQDLQKMIQGAVKNSGADGSISTELTNKFEKELSDFITLNSLKADMSTEFQGDSPFLPVNDKLDWQVASDITGKKICRLTNRFFVKNLYHAFRLASLWPLSG